MQRGCVSAVLLMGILFFHTSSFAAPKTARFTKADSVATDLPSVLQKINQSLSENFVPEDFQLIESRDLATGAFRTYVQMAGQWPIPNTSLRLWDLTTSETPTLLQLEAQVESKEIVKKALAKSARVQLMAVTPTEEELLESVRTKVNENSEDKNFGAVAKKDFLSMREGKLRLYTIKAKSGTHLVWISLQTGKITEYRYQPFATADEANTNTNDEFSVYAQVYPIYEHSEKDMKLQYRMPKELKYIKRQRANATSDLYAALRNQHYYESKLDFIRAKTPEGQADGYWSPEQVIQSASELKQSLPTADNTFAIGLDRPVYLTGRYATINFHPNAFKGLKQPLPFEPSFSTELKTDWQWSGGNTGWEFVPLTAYLGNPLYTPLDALLRPARVLPNHEPASYMADGFDELQVYYAVNQLMDSLHTMGFSDPGLSTRPFHAFLYDPDISMRNNAYYTDDTINFTTYSGDAQNFARDNSTVWHELGHGVMDRLMGPYLQFADTGGLSEGMADFMAALVIQDVTKGESFDGSGDFRIINRTGFQLTNEVHDDGEAYGGSMKDILDAAIAQFGQEGLKKVADITLDAMRLTRNHPALTANVWFEHMLYADELGKPGVRNEQELRGIILAALAGRNFSIEGKTPANLEVRYTGSEELPPALLTNSDEGSRNRPIPVKLKESENALYTLQVKLSSSDVYAFQYPVTVHVEYNKGALQGAIHWTAEDTKPADVVLNSEQDVAQIPVQALGKCDAINREDGSCVDYAYVQVFENGKSKPTAKKRFYLKVMPQL